MNNILLRQSKLDILFLALVFNSCIFCTTIFLVIFSFEIKSNKNIIFCSMICEFCFNLFFCGFLLRIIKSNFDFISSIYLFNNNSSSFSFLSLAKEISCFFVENIFFKLFIFV